MSENRRTQDAASDTGHKGPIERLGQVLKSEDGVIEIPGIRQSDLQPYVGLRYLSKLFKLMGVILGLLLLANGLMGNRPGIANMRPVDLIYLLGTGACLGAGLVAVVWHFADRRTG